MTRCIRLFAFLTLFSLLALGVAHAVPVAADHLRPSFMPPPIVTDVSAAAPARGVFTVAGRQFSPGGRVYLALYDQMGAKLYETRWIEASSTTTVIHHQPGDGPLGGDRVTVGGGTLRASFANLCGATAMLRALDGTTNTWSNWLTVEPACSA
jgi:hypothetical protein